MKSMDEITVITDYMIFGNEQVSNIEKIMDNLNGETELIEAVRLINQINGN